MIPILILALDLALGTTGICQDGTTTNVHWKGDGTERLCHAYNEIRALAIRADQVVIEGYAFASRFNKAYTVGELGGVARLAIAHAGHEPLVVAPASLKRYATGIGNAPKAQVVSAATARAGRTFDTDDEADAWWLYAFARDLAGRPVIKLPAKHLVALEKYR